MKDIGYPTKIVVDSKFVKLRPVVVFLTRFGNVSDIGNVVALEQTDVFLGKRCVIGSMRRVG